MVFPPPNVYGEPMSRLLCLSIAVAVSLLSVVAQAAPVQKKPKPVWHGYGFLPGYQQPLSNSQPSMPRKRTAALRTPEPPPLVYRTDPCDYGWEASSHYVGRPGFYNGHYNGGTLVRAGRGTRSGRSGIAADRSGLVQGSACKGPAISSVSPLPACGERSDRIRRSIRVRGNGRARCNEFKMIAKEPA